MCHYGRVMLALTFKECKNIEMSLNFKLEILLSFMN